MSATLLRRLTHVPSQPQSQQHVRLMSSTTRRAPRVNMLDSPLVSATWLNKNLSRTRVLDGSWFMPSDPRNAQAEFEQKHIKGARFFDLDKVADHATTLPHMLPSLDQFLHAMRQLDIAHDTTVVAYDSRGLFSAARVWFTLKVFGARDVGVLDGGLPMWEFSRYEVESGGVHPPLTPPIFLPKDLRYRYVSTFDEVLANAKLITPDFQVVDARSAGRFSGAEQEPRAGLPSGHIPHSINVPYNSVLRTNEQGVVVMKDPEEIRALLVRSGVDVSNPNQLIVASCGSGVTACVLALSLELIGHRNWRVYDGSWSEWASRPDAIIRRL